MLEYVYCVSVANIYIPCSMHVYIIIKGKQKLSKVLSLIQVWGHPPEIREKEKEIREKEKNRAELIA